MPRRQLPAACTVGRPGWKCRPGAGAPLRALIHALCQGCWEEPEMGRNGTLRAGGDVVNSMDRSFRAGTLGPGGQHAALS